MRVYVGVRLSNFYLFAERIASAGDIVGFDIPDRRALSDWHAAWLVTSLAHETAGGDVIPEALAVRLRALALVA